MGKAKLKVIAAMLIFGTISLFVKNIALASSEIALYRGILGSLFLLMVLLIKRDKVPWPRLKENRVPLLLSGAAIGFNWILLFEAYKYTTVSNATLSYYFAPVFVMLASPFIFKEKLTAVRVGCILLAMVGMYLIVGRGTVGGEGFNHPLGILYGIGAAAFYACVVILNKFLKGLSGLESTMFQLMIASLVLAPYIFITEGFDVLAIPKVSLPYLLVLGVVHTGVAYVLYFSAMQELKSQTIATLSYIDPISAVLVSALFLNENLTPIQLIGGIFILGSTFISESGLLERDGIKVNRKVKSE